ncbi:hypothetical protein BO82DRAFT_428743 [Aspergillus uvarum CBS 121591]|uniref:Uncharacterized protein n=1 Tax=Aspergillus uvarum CBS 121591 TaxID=1448315 RepID=A0A319DDY5_9EURO|nr:hypothetical protein BO82DRAFT_428743 [Aspergillus uvarum CBS 121591]PYH86298.1 hypothetical protein BO82DRAFT_428743 [Aspergillus uvarum CBS 121591]
MTLTMYTDSPRRLERRRFLVDLEYKIETLQAHKLDLLQLKELKVEIQQLSLCGAPAPFSLQPSADDYKFWKDVYESMQPEFAVFHMTDMPGRGFPHMMAVIYNGLEVENQGALRGELLIILRMMICARS